MKAALEASPDHIPARWVAARLLEARGKLEEAVQACKWFVDHYNTRPPTSPATPAGLLHGRPGRGALLPGHGPG